MSESSPPASAAAPPPRRGGGAAHRDQRDGVVKDGQQVLGYGAGLDRGGQRDYFAVDKSIITNDLVKICYEASVETFDAYRAMFFDPRRAGNDLAIAEE